MLEFQKNNVLKHKHVCIILHRIYMTNVFMVYLKLKFNWVSWFMCDLLIQQPQKEMSWVISYQIQLP